VVGGSQGITKQEDGLPFTKSPTSIMPMPEDEKERRCRERDHLYPGEGEGPDNARQKVSLS
jgi:hypothetical protein